MYKISDETMYQKIVDQLGQQAGVYVLRCLKKKKVVAHYCRVGRLLGFDYGGILYIGSGDPVCNRAGQLRAALCAAARQQGYINVAAHGVGELYALGGVQRRYPFERLCVAITAVAPGEDHYIMEQQMLDEYIERYGEAPPFNRNRNV